MIISDFENFESKVMNAIINENANISYFLKQQYSIAKIVSREFTGVGFFTEFEISDKSLKLDKSPNLTLGTISAEIKGLNFGMGFVLFVNDGLIATLEGYTYSEPWYGTVENFRIIKE
ncbi:MAG: hypothetical protein FWG64_04765 [Firmicutes bacterium]|nr:hypothetical protein [Bacillota bacterium]